MNLQDGAVGVMEPRHHDQLGTGRDSIQRPRECGVYLEGRLRRAFEGLTRRISTVAEGRSHDPNRCHIDRHLHGVIFS
jgi:hypothetical protein